MGEMVSETRMRRPSERTALGLEMLDPLAGLQAGDDPIFLGDAFGRDDQRDVAADRLVGRVAEETLGGGVPALNDAVERLADDRVIRGFDDRREQPGREQLAGLVLFQPPLRGDVPENQDASGDRAAFVADRRGAVVDRALAAVLANQHRVIRQANDDPLAKRFRRRVLDRPARLLVDDAEHRVERLADGIRLHPAGQRFGDGIHVRDAAVDVGGDDRVADAAQRDAQQLAPLAGARLREPRGLAERR